MSNLYSLLAKRGRLGDSELRYVDGELSHVNPMEAELIDDYGPEGESFVQKHGSGAINPETGLKEYEPITTALAALGLTYKVGSGLYSFFTGKERNRQVRGAIDDSIDSLKSARGDIRTAGSIELERAFEASGIEEEETFLDFLRESEDINTRQDFLTSTSDLALSGEVIKQAESEKSDLAKDFEIESDLLGLRQEERFANIFEREANALADIDRQIQSLEIKKAQYS